MSLNIFFLFNRIIKYLQDTLLNCLKNTAESNSILQSLTQRIILVSLLQSHTSLKDYNWSQPKSFYILFDLIQDKAKDRQKGLNGFEISFLYLYSSLIQRIETLQIHELNYGQINEIIPENVWTQIFNEIGKGGLNLIEDQNEEEQITPLIFGQLFEGSIDQKHTGAFYTPTHICKYISEETIDTSLTKKLNSQFGTQYESIFRQIFNVQEHSDQELQYIKYLYFQLLPEFTVADVTSGAGDFLIAALNVLKSIYQQSATILWEDPDFQDERKSIDSNNNREIYFKREILTNNLFGVDIQAGGVEISRLRLWSNLIASSTFMEWNDPDFLPPIENNFKVGNTLLGLICDPIANHIKNKTNTKLGVTYFQWAIEFPEIFARGGFDVILGNPPYGQNTISQDMRQVLQETWQPFSLGKKSEGKTYNISAIFIERIYHLLNPNGEFGLIINNSIARVEEFTGIRKFLLEHGMIRKVVDEGNPFKYAKVTLEMLDFFYSKNFYSDYFVQVINNRNPLESKENLISVSIWKQYERFILYADNFFDQIYSNAEIKILDGTRGRDAKKIDQPNSTYTIPYLFSGKTVKKYRFDCNEIEYVSEQLKNKNTWLTELNQEDLLVATKITNKYRVTLKPKGFLVGNNVIKITSSQIIIDPIVLMAILNSRLMDFIVKRYIINESELTTAFYNSITDFTPIYLPQNLTPFRTIGEYLLILNLCEDQDSIKDWTEILNVLVDELYFKKNQSLSEMIIFCFLGIDFKALFSQYWQNKVKNGLNCELEPYIHEKLQETKQLIDQSLKMIQESNEIMVLIEEIKKNEWIRQIP
jgi:hypothetical protein